jgi:hypothetical protein
MNIYKRRLTNNSLLDHKIQTLKNNVNYKSSNTSICYNIQKNILIGKSTLNKYANIKIATDIDNIDNATDTTINNHSSEISTKQICKMFSDQYKDVYLNENGQVYGYTVCGEMDSIGYNTSTGHTNVTFDEFISDFGNNFLNDVYTELMDGIENQTNSTIDTFLSNHSDWGTAYNVVQPMDECGYSQDFSNPVFNYSNYIVCEHFKGHLQPSQYDNYAIYDDSYLFFRGGSSEDTLIGWSDSGRSIYTDTNRIHNIRIAASSNTTYADRIMTTSDYKTALGLNGNTYGGFQNTGSLYYSKFTAIMETLELNKILKQYTSFCSDFDTSSNSDPKIYHHESSAYTDNYVKVTPLANYGYYEALAKMRTLNNKYSEPTLLDTENISKTWIKSKIPLNVAKNIENDIIPIYHRYNYDFKFKFLWDSSPSVFYATANSGYTGFTMVYSNSNSYGPGIIRCFNNFKIGTKFEIPNYTSEFNHNYYRNKVYCKQNTFINLLLNNIDTKYRKMINNLKDLSFIINSSTVSSYISTKKPLSKFIKTNRDLAFTDDTFATASAAHCITTYARTDNPTQYTYFSSTVLGNDTIQYTGGGGYTWYFKYPDALSRTYLSDTSYETAQRASSNKNNLDNGIRDYFINPIKTKLIERIDNNSYTTTKPSYSSSSLRKQFINHVSYSGALEK